MSGIDVRSTQLQLRTLNITFACAPDNDLFMALTPSGYGCRRYETAMEAFDAAPKDSAVLILAEAYPPDTSAPGSRALDAAFSKHLMVYLEHPSVGTEPEAAVGQGTEW